MTNKTVDTEYLVLAGIAADDKPHAARFPVTEIAPLRKAAELMSMRLGKATGDAALKVARKLPEGKIFSAGKALVPLVKASLYDELLKVVTFHDMGPAAATQSVASKPAEEKAAGTSPPSSIPLDLWNTIKVGSVVLCRFVDEEPAWWESVVIAINKDGDTLTVRWRDYPKLKPFTVKRLSVSILAPEPPVKAG